MAKSQNRFCYPFEREVIQLDDQLQNLIEGGADASEIESLKQQRDGALRQMTEGLTPYERVLLARRPRRPQSLDYIRMIVSDFIELHGDRRFGDDGAVVTGLGRIEGERFLIIAQQKGRETKEKVQRNFGMPRSEGYRKALLKMRLAEQFRLPVLSLIDTAGAACDQGAEERGIAMAIAENLFEMARLRTPIILVNIGEACSGGALGVGVGDRFGMFENAYYSVITPEGCAAILWKTSEAAAQAADAMKLTANNMLELGIIDRILPEPAGGAHRDPEAAALTLREYVLGCMAELRGIPIDTLLEQRYQRYRKLGVFADTAS